MNDSRHKKRPPRKFRDGQFRKKVNDLLSEYKLSCIDKINYDRGTNCGDATENDSVPALFLFFTQRNNSKNDGDNTKRR